MLTARNNICLAGLIAFVLWPVATYGQARSRHQWYTGGLRGLRTVGGSDFTTYSSGLGGLQRSSPTGTGGVLRSTIAATSSYNLRRSGAGATPLTTVLPKSTGLKGQTYGSTEVKLRVPTGGPGPAKIFPSAGAGAAAGVWSYLAAKGGKAIVGVEGAEPIASFVPDEPSYYQEYMKKGEDAFRAERYLEAARTFDIAATIGRYAPESHLSLVHAYSALGRYYSASYHLREALKYFPELPLASLRVRLFYSRVETFVGHLEKLRESAEKVGADADLSLLLAYFQYFDGNEADAATALRQGFAGSSSRATTEAIDTFWSGMVAAGKVEGTLGPTTTRPARPDTDSTPVRPKPEPTTRPGQAQHNTDKEEAKIGSTGRRGAE